jgi:hypothetical protein
VSASPVTRIVTFFSPVKTNSFEDGAWHPVTFAADYLIVELPFTSIIGAYYAKPTVIVIVYGPERICFVVDVVERRSVNV